MSTDCHETNGLSHPKAILMRKCYALAHNAGNLHQKVIALKLYNTLTKSLDDVTSDDGIFRMYVCGVTPYDTTHLGHAFTYVCFDVLARYLEFSGYETLRVQNVTDIDDDIIKRAREVGMKWDELGNRENEKFLTDMRALHVLKPHHYPRATEEVPRIIDMVETLLEKGHAYEVKGNVYYDVSSDNGFATHLVDMDYDEQLKIANERGNFPDDANKTDPLDFVLWQAAQPNEPTWDSPWGPGRPGWHIECSAMSMHYLGPTIDIHSGGADLIFPHHSCEIVQSERFSGEAPFVRYWFHIAMVYLEGEKMSKSLGNMLFIRELIKDYSADAIRLYLLSYHYREEWHADDHEAGLTSAATMLKAWHDALHLPRADGELIDVTSQREAFTAAMDNDLDTQSAIQALDGLAKQIQEAAKTDADPSQAQTTLRELGGVLGLVLDTA